MQNLKIEVDKAYLNKLKGRLQGLLCEREKDREWEKFYDNIMIELMGFPEEKRTINYEILCRKFSACKYLRFSYFRLVISLLLAFPYQCSNMPSFRGQQNLSVYYTVLPCCTHE